MTLNFTLAMGSHFVVQQNQPNFATESLLPIFSDSVAPERPSWKFVIATNLFGEKIMLVCEKNIFDKEKTLEVVKEIKMKRKISGHVFHGIDLMMIACGYMIMTFLHVLKNGNFLCCISKYAC